MHCRIGASSQAGWISFDFVSSPLPNQQIFCNALVFGGTLLCIHMGNMYRHVNIQKQNKNKRKWPPWDILHACMVSNYWQQCDNPQHPSPQIQTSPTSYTTGGEKMTGGRVPGTNRESPSRTHKAPETQLHMEVCCCKHDLG